MKLTTLWIAVAAILAFFAVPECAIAQEYEGGGRIVTGGGGSNPLGNITLTGGTTLGSSAGTYTTSVDNADGSYTLHHITVDAASNVISHKIEKFKDDGTSAGTTEVPGSVGEKMGDVIGGGLENSFYSEPGGCLSFHCNDSEPGLGGGFSDPYSWSFTSADIGG